MKEEWFQTIGQMEKFLETSGHIEFDPSAVNERYDWANRILKIHKYEILNRYEKGIVRKFLGKVTGYKTAQVTRLIRKYRRTGSVKRTLYQRNTFPKKYTYEDIRLLAATDQLHKACGPVIKHILKREYKYGDQKYGQISNISVSHIYNLRKKSSYREIYTQYTKTSGKPNQIGERAKPRHNGEPGYIRVDVVHQGDLNGSKGVYHINAVDEVTQWEIVVSVEKISEAFMIPALAELLSQFPFVIKGFHSDNGSEFINYQVANLLNKLNIRLTKSRARKTNDNALVESKNAWVIRKTLGYGHIPQPMADHINLFNNAWLNVYLNFHRPCLFAQVRSDKKGKVKKTYPQRLVKTPFERFLELPECTQYLCDDVSLEYLQNTASEYSDNQFKERMEKAEEDLWTVIRRNCA